MAFFGTVSAGNDLGFRNRIINGDMRIDQRGSASSPITSGGRAYAVDRWCCEKSGSGAFTLGQSSTAPTGFQNSLLATVTTADTSIASGDIYWIEQRIEGYNFADLLWGTADAKTVTLSFWVRSNLTGTYSVCPTTGSSRTFDYTINSANTWEYKTIVITGPGTGVGYGGSPTNGTGITLRFALAAGSTYAQAPSAGWVQADIVGSTNQVNWMNTLSNNFYITGVQFEVGSVATPFERRTYGTELQLCQRYFEKNFNQTDVPADLGSNGFSGGGNGWVSFSTTNIRGPLFAFKVTKRTAPSITTYKGNGSASNNWGIYDSGAATWRSTSVGTMFSTDTEFRSDSTTSGWTPTTGNAYLFSGWWTASAEL